MLDLIGAALEPHLSSVNLLAARIDGRSTLQQRRDALNRFNSDNGCVIMLATVGAVGEGCVFANSNRKSKANARFSIELI
jgi:SWI/SNF-related matrix-associated actin-dependent regulator of chromatin subfamily A3